MAGIYLHVPFCTKKCAYCDFYSLANPKLKNDFVQALLQEIELQKHYLDQERIQTIYFGGGTPSLLSIEQLDKILDALHHHFRIEKNIELTLEANPENLTNAYLSALNRLGFNRLSIGIQSLARNDLELMRRTHTPQTALEAVDLAKNKGFKNISVDLIYGLPQQGIKEWENNLNRIIDMDIQHLSAYHLTIEPGTLFKKWYDQHKIQLPDEKKSLEQYRLLVEKTAAHGFLHYEISNFAKDGFLSLHNTNYWMGVKYLGLGPSAHSFDLTSRQWNISNLGVYLYEISKGNVPKEKEVLTLKEKFNEYIITSFRTMWGVDIKKVELNFEGSMYNNFLKKIQKYKKDGFVTQNHHQFKLSEKGVMISDHILADLFYD